MSNIRRKNITDTALGDIVNVSTYSKTYEGCLVVAFEHEEDNVDEKYHVYCVLPDSYIPNESNPVSSYKRQINNDDCITSISNPDLYINKPGLWLGLRFITDVFEIDPGCNCKGCGLHFEWAEPNQPDKTFCCYSCRQNPMRAYY